MDATNVKGCSKLEALGGRAGDKLLMVVRGGKVIVLGKELSIRGLASSRNDDPVDTTGHNCSDDITCLYNYRHSSVWISGDLC